MVVDLKIKFFLLLLFANVYAAENSDELQILKNDVELLIKKINSFEENKISTQTQDVKMPLTHRNMLELKNAQTILSVGGRIHLNSVYGWPEGSFFAAKIPLESKGEEGQLSMNAKDSRLWFKTRTPSQYGPLRTLIEIDFLGSAGTDAVTNSHQPRLRHAYLEFAGFTLGQTNSAFNSLVALDTITYAINDTLVRQALVRYTIDDDLFSYDISVEDPESTLLDKNGTMLMPKDDVAPDLILRARYYPSWGEASLAFLGRYIAYDNVKLSDNTVLDNSDGAYGWGINISGKFKVYKLDDIRFDAQYGLGLGRYVAYNAYSAGSINDEGDINLHPTYGWHVGYRHWWSQKLRSTLGFSRVETKNNLDNLNTANLKAVNKKADSLQLNLLWMPVPDSLTGIEYSRGNREVQEGTIGTIDMLTLFFRYVF
ncbi:porin [bacterium]|nr:porin [bacterium]MBU1991211.1 porin [bacterium]